MVGAISRPSPCTKSTAAVCASRMWHSTSWPCACAHSSLDSRQAAAPSVSGVELPAVSVPRPEALSKAGLSVASFSIEVSDRSEEHTSELQSLMRISYADFCLKKKTTNTHIHVTNTQHL